MRIGICGNPWWNVIDMSFNVFVSSVNTVIDNYKVLFLMFEVYEYDNVYPRWFVYHRALCCAIKTSPSLFCKFYSSNVTYVAFIMYHSPVSK